MIQQQNIMGNKKSSLLTYLIFLLIALVTIFWGRQLALHYENIRVWDFTGWLFLLIGIPFILLQKEAGLPELWQPSVSNKKRIWIPLATGLFFALLDVIVIIVILHPEPYKTLPPFLQPFPYSVVLYTSGAFEVEVFYRLIPITLALFFAQRFFPKYATTIFWIMAILTSLREPIEQFQQGALWYVLYSFISGFAMNFLQVVFYKKAGFLASLFTRLGHYLLWHILLGLYIEYFML
jgi:hypothetical protein